MTITSVSGTWTKIGLNNTDTNDQGAFGAANKHFVAPADGTYLFGATLEEQPVDLVMHVTSIRGDAHSCSYLDEFA